MHPGRQRTLQAAVWLGSYPRCALSLRRAFIHLLEQIVHHFFGGLRPDSLLRFEQAWQRHLQHEVLCPTPLLPSAPSLPKSARFISLHPQRCAILRLTSELLRQPTSIEPARPVQNAIPRLKPGAPSASTKNWELPPIRCAAT